MTAELMTSRQRNATGYLVREDYHRQTQLTQAEAALIAGRALKTIQHWLATGQLSRCNMRGPYQIDHSALLKFLQTGRK